MLKDKLRSRSAADLRRERDELGFVRQPEVRWMSPGLLARSGVEVIVSGAFGKFADKRELQREPQEALDYSDATGDLWVDYLSDTGDGWEATYTMAWLLTRPALEAGGETLPRGRILLLGGDEVYPSATPEQYEDRFIGPFASALPRSEHPDKPDMFALPGNHDWYDGLASFLRVFCAREGRVGDWRTRQRRSYFAISLPNDWWIWAIDIQLDTYIDDVQLDYFLGQKVGAGDKVILMTAKPAWVKAVPERTEPSSWRYLSYFEERVVRAKGAKLALVLTGDRHHYARYEPLGDDTAPTRITAGGGGAYLSPTHTLRQTLDLRSLDHDTSVPYERAEIYPREQVSRRLSNGVLKLARLNPSFAALLGAVYVLLGLAMLGALNAGGGALLDGVDGFGGFVSKAAGGLIVVLALLLWGGVFAATDITPDALETKTGRRGATQFARVLVALAHTLIHLLLAAALVYLAASIAPDDVALVAWLLSGVMLFAAGFAVGSTVFAVVLLAIHRIRGPKAQEAANQVFTAQSIADYKNLVRIRFAADGSVTLYPLGVDRIGRRWRYEGKREQGARFEPRDGPPQVRPIDGPLKLDAAGRRSY
ncbi:MAG: metallophosphoesterase [Actinobacteria bacterium]|nr:metallophosphoesterase [Actinomycetota bacterium]